MEFVNYARAVVIPRISTERARQKIQDHADTVENMVTRVRFGNQIDNVPLLIQRLERVCLLAGVVGVALLIFSAFYKSFALPPAMALLLVIGLFVPVPAALHTIRAWALRSEPAIREAKEQLQKSISDALSERRID